MSEPKTEPKTHMTAEECFESLNGYEEIAIARAFGSQVTTLADEQPTTFSRALVFVMEKRGGLNDTDAKAAVMERPLLEIHGYFTEEAEDLNPEDPDSEEGKDDSSPGGSPLT